MRVIICGGRKYVDQNTAFAWLDALHSKTPISFIIEGGAAGADTLGRTWAIVNGISFVTVRADWAIHKKDAGFLRNIRMRDEFQPDMVLALPGGVGTKMMVKLARDKGIPVEILQGPYED